MKVKINETEYDVTDVFDLTNVISELHKVWWANAHEIVREKIVEEVAQELVHDDSVKDDIINNLTHAEREDIADDFVRDEYGYESVDNMNDLAEKYKSALDEIHEISRM